MLVLTSSRPVHLVVVLAVLATSELVSVREFTSLLTTETLTEVAMPTSRLPTFMLWLDLLRGTASSMAEIMGEHTRFML